MTKDVDIYFADGCARCKMFATPQCKVRKWNSVLSAMREVLIETDLVEECKWGAPCYTYNGKNVVLMGAFKDFCSISFLKGSLLSDPNDLLEFAGENSHIAKLMKFTDSKTVLKNSKAIKAFIKEAIAFEVEGTKVVIPIAPQQELPEELVAQMAINPTLKNAFEALTPGRQRSYVLHINQAKASATRLSRIEKCLPKMLLGKGFNEY